MSAARTQGLLDDHPQSVSVLSEIVTVPVVRGPGVCLYILSTRQGLSAQSEPPHRPDFSGSSFLSLWALPLAPEVFSVSGGIPQSVLALAVAAITKCRTA